MSKNVNELVIDESLVKYDLSDVLSNKTLDFIIYFKSLLLNFFKEIIHISKDISFIDITFACIYGITLALVLRSIFSSIPSFSKSNKNSFSIYLYLVIATTFAKIFCILYIVALYSLLIPVFTFIDTLIKKNLDYDLLLSNYQMMVLTFWVLFIYKVHDVLKDERKQLRNFKAEIVPSDFFINFNEKFNLEIPSDIIKGTKFFKMSNNFFSAMAFSAPFIAPRIYFSSAMLLPSQSDKLAPILVHEMTHIRRFDSFMTISLSTYISIFKFFVDIFRKVANFFEVLMEKPIFKIRIFAIVLLLPILILSLFNFFIRILNYILDIMCVLDVFVSRQAELFADAEAAIQTSPSRFLSALFNINEQYFNYSINADHTLLIRDRVESVFEKVSTSNSNVIDHDFEQLLNEIQNSKNLETHPSLTSRVLWASNFSSFYTFIDQHKYFVLSRFNPKWFRKIFLLSISILAFLTLLSQIRDSIYFNAVPKDVIDYEYFLKTGDYPLETKDKR